MPGTGQPDPAARLGFPGCEREGCKWFPAGGGHRVREPTVALALTAPPPALPRLQKEIEVLENAGPLTTAAGEGAAAPSPAKDEKTEVALDSRQVRR